MKRGWVINTQWALSEGVGDKHTMGTQYVHYDVLTVSWGVWVQSIQDAQDGSVTCDCGWADGDCHLSEQGKTKRRWLGEQEVACKQGMLLLWASFVQLLPQGSYRHALAPSLDPMTCALSNFTNKQRTHNPPSTLKTLWGDHRNMYLKRIQKAPILHCSRSTSP